jgi:hypothetical protein
LREIIREEDQNTRVTLLEYLKQLHSSKWGNFVKDTKILAEESAMYNGPTLLGDEKVSKTDNLSFYCIGFKSSSPEFTLHTRIWSSLCAQTLYRTVSGMMNYGKTIKLLYRVKNPDVVQTVGGNTNKLEHELELMERQKFKFIVSMQRYSKFNKEEHENAEFLLCAYPELQITYLKEEPARKEWGDPQLFSALIDGHSEFDIQTGKRQAKFRIELPGNPILGDGKLDNQNHTIIFYHGKYLQLIDDVGGRVKVDDMGDVGDTETMSNDSGGNHDGSVTLTECLKGHFMFSLGSVTVDRCSRVVVGNMEVGENVGHPLGLHEHKSQTLRLHDKDVQEDRALIRVFNVLYVCDQPGSHWSSQILPLLGYHFCHQSLPKFPPA